VRRLRRFVRANFLAVRGFECLVRKKTFRAGFKMTRAWHQTPSAPHQMLRADAQTIRAEPKTASAD